MTCGDFSLFPRGFGPLSPSGIAKTAENTSLWASGTRKVLCFLDRTATRVGGGARGGSRRRRGAPGAARRLPEDSILIRTVKHVASEAQVRQNIVNLRISEGVPGGPPGDLFVVSSRVWAAFAPRGRENSGKHVTLGLRDVRTAIRQLLDSY